MDRARYRQIDELLHAALLEPPEKRAALLNRACADDPELRQHVASLLLAHDEAESFIEGPAFARAEEMLSANPTETVEPRLAAGVVLGHHRVIEPLGAGGMGEVYLAEDTTLGRRVALKVLHRSMTGDDVSRRRFLREARLASQLEHPNICTVWETGEEDGCCYISMRHIEGETLQKHLDARGRAPLAPRTAVSISLQVAHAVAAAHRSGILHRDIKASNVIIDGGGHATVLDFGLAVPLEPAGGSDSAGLTRPGSIHGTPAYMSPEQARGRDLDHRSDIFSLGVLMYELVTGRLPFHRESPVETMHAVIHERHLAAVDVNPDTPLELSRIIDRSLQKEPSARYRSMEELIGDLEAVELSRPGRAITLGRLRQTVRGLAGKRRSRLYGSAVLVVLSFLGTVAVVRRPAEPAVSAAASTARPRLNTLAVLPFKPLVASNRDEVLEMGMTDALITRLSGVRDLVVRPMSAVRGYTGLEQDAVNAGRKQRVDAVLDGTVQRYENRVRVTVRLTRVQDEQVLWTRSFDSQADDLFAVQDAISERVARALSLRLAGDEPLLPERRTPAAGAYRAYLLGRYHSQQGSLTSVRRSVEYFTQAVEADPAYALAWAGLADAYTSLERFGASAEGNSYVKARQAATNALALDNRLAEPHLALALAAEGLDWNWPEAERSYRRAIALNPNHADAHRLLARFLAAMGRVDEAIVEAQTALDLAPASVPAISNLAFALYMGRRYERAVEQIETVIEMNPRFGDAHFLLGLSYAAQGKYDPAIAALERAIDLTGRTDFAGALGAAYARAGRLEKTREILDALMTRSAANEEVSSISLAVLHLALGEEERALDWLERMVERREWNVHILKAAPQLDPLRSHPRFKSLLSRAGFPPAGPNAS